MKTRIMIMMATAASLLAQRPGPRPEPSLDALKTYLNLTDSQVQGLQQIRQQGGKRTGHDADNSAKPSQFGQHAAEGGAIRRDRQVTGGHTGSSKQHVETHGPFSAQASIR